MKTKDLIIEEFIKSFGENGFEGTSVDYLAKQVGIKIVEKMKYLLLPVKKY